MVAGALNFKNVFYTNTFKIMFARAAIYTNFWPCNFEIYIFYSNIFKCLITYLPSRYEYSHPYYRTRYQGTTYEPYFKTSYYSPYRANVYNRMSISFNKALAAYRSGLTDFSTLNHGHITRNYLDKQGCDWRRLYEPKTERLHYHQPHLYRNRQFLTAWT